MSALEPGPWPGEPAEVTSAREYGYSAWRVAQDSMIYCTTEAVRWGSFVPLAAGPDAERRLVYIGAVGQAAEAALYELTGACRDFDELALHAYADIVQRGENAPFDLASFFTQKHEEDQ